MMQSVLTISTSSTVLKETAAVSRASYNRDYGFGFCRRRFCGCAHSSVHPFVVRKQITERKRRRGRREERENERAEWLHTQRTIRDRVPRRKSNITYIYLLKIAKKTKERLPSSCFFSNYNPEQLSRVYLIYSSLPWVGV